MSLGLIALLLAGLGAGWLLFRSALGRPEGARQTTLLKAVIWLGLAAALFAVKLWPLALMVLIAAGGVAAIEMWRDRTIQEEEAAAGANAPATTGPMTAKEAASILGVAPDADAEEIRAAHRKLIAQIHPDKGGNDYLAAKINEARDYLLERRGEG